MSDTIKSMQERISDFMYQVYGLMSIAFAITAITAYYVARTPEIFKPLITKPMIFIGIIFVQLLLVIILTSMLSRLNFFMASFLFFVYALSMGITFSTIFLVFQMSSIYIAFLVSAIMFASMSIYGYFTKTDLTSFSNLITMALFGLIIGLVVNLFFRSGIVDIVLSAFGVILFTALTAYDTQKLKQMARLMITDGILPGQVAIYGALSLYLDFINLFLFVLQLTGRRK